MGPTDFNRTHFAMLENKKGPEGPFVTKVVPDFGIWSGRWDSNPRP